MKRISLKTMLGLTVMTLLAQASQASIPKIIDWKGHLSWATIGVKQVKTTIYWEGPLGPEEEWGWMWDFETLQYNRPTNLIIVAYAELLPNGEGTADDLIKITTVHARDLNPYGENYQPNVFNATGFDPTDPPFVPMGDHTFVSRQGFPFNSNGYQTVPLGALPALLPDADLSGFGGNPANIVYLSRTIVPRSQFMISNGFQQFLGVVKLDGWIGSERSLNVVPLEIMLDSQALAEANLRGSGDTGVFLIPIPPSGQHSVRVKPHGFLAKRLNASNGVNGNGAVFTPGDTNNDNKIDDFDLSAVIFDFGSVGGQSGFTDLNGDGKVNDFDLAAVIFNFGERGDN